MLIKILSRVDPGLLWVDPGLLWVSTQTPQGPKISKDLWELSHLWIAWGRLLDAFLKEIHCMKLHTDITGHQDFQRSLETEPFGMIWILLNVIPYRHPRNPRFSKISGN